MINQGFLWGVATSRLTEKDANDKMSDLKFQNVMSETVLPLSSQKLN